MFRKRTRRTLTQAPTKSRFSSIRRRIRGWSRKLVEWENPPFVPQSVSGIRRKDLRKRDYWNPIFWIQWSGSFVLNWFATRHYFKLTGAVPAIFAGLGSVVLFGVGFISNPAANSHGLREVFSDAVESENYRRAEIAIGALLKQSPTSRELLYQKAVVDWRLGAVQETQKQMVELASTHKHPMAALWLISQEFDMQSVDSWSFDEHGEFRRLVEIALSQLEGQDLVSTQLLMASYLVATGNHGESLRYYDAVLVARPEQALSALSIARQQADSERIHRYSRIAVSTFQRQLQSSPTNTESRIALAQTWLMTGKAKEAAQLLNDGYRLNKDPRVARLLGTALLAWSNTMAKGEDNALKRLQILQSAVGVSPQDQMIAQSMIRVLIQCRDHSDPKVRELRDRVLDSMNGATADFVKGTVALLENRFEQALSHLKLASARQRNMPAIMNNLAVAISRTPGGNLEHALLLVNESLKGEPTHPYFLETRGSILVRMARFEEAIPDLEKALKAAELKPLVFPTLAMAYKKVGKDRLAREYELLSESTN